MDKKNELKYGFIAFKMSKMVIELPVLAKWEIQRIEEQSTTFQIYINSESHMLM